MCGQKNTDGNAQLFADSTLTSEQSDLIYQKSKDFPNNLQISIALIKNGSVHFAGVKKHNDTIYAVNNSNSFFEIGSITKLFTCTLLADFVLDRKVQLEDDINTYLPFKLNNGSKINFEELANHTSGLPRLPTNLNLEKVNPANPYQEYDEKELIHYLTQEMILSGRPGTNYEYSNLGVGLLGYLLGKIDQVPYEQLLQSYIFEKYGMPFSTTVRKNIKRHLVKGINDEGIEVPNWDMNVLTGAGGILSSTYELAKFAMAQFDENNNELALTRKATFKNSDQMKTGLGWAMIDSENQSVWYWHNGGTGGYTSSIIVDTKNKNGVIVLSNISAFSKNTGKIGELAHELMRSISE